MRSLIVGMSSAAFAVAAHAVSYTWPADTSGGLRFEGVSYEVSQTTGDMTNNGGAIVVTNATLNAWNADADRVNFLNESGGTTTLDKGGTFRVYSLKSDGVLNLNAGSRLELEKFIYSKSASGRINANGGLVAFRKVTNPSKYYLFENYSSFASGWIVNVMEGGLVVSNVVNATVYAYAPPIKSGVASDGGVTYKGEGMVFAANNNNNDFNGGVTVAGNLTLAVNKDKCFGAVPATPADNIFWKSGGTLFGNATDLEVDRNRNIVISPGVRFAGGSSSSLRILGTIRSEVVGDKSTSIRAATSSAWNGALVLSPGVGRTNRVGRLQADGRLVVESGTTIVCTNTAAGTVDPNYSVVGIQGNNSAYNDSKGVFEVKGGELRSEGTGAVPIKQYGQLIVSGGRCDFWTFNTQSIWNGYGSPGRTVVKNGGELRCYSFRLTNNEVKIGDDIPTQLSLVTGGVVQCHEFLVGAAGHVCRIDFDGGAMKPTANWNNFLGNSTTEWPNVPVYVHEGGAIFDSNGFDIGVHLPLQSAAANDGGLTKKGAGKLTLSKANTYNGPTRVLGGKVTFQSAAGFPGGDIEIDAEELASRGANDPFISSSASITFNSGSKLRILVPAGFDLERLRMNRAVVTSASPMSGDLPTAVAVDAETGDELPITTHVLRCSFNATRGTLYVRSLRRGTIIIVK